eukprot:CAMPEP_0197897384 /NCGR_PEP_ID=MMETSP1439-20131203/42157_1 /TAXON_ID=66791 /ORGANISM="Gonyaulax spinifera, Strain CCMP409" /LENGTH=34 /DNA_ID= /DNA_START= /DNA_END= /DNA_ORIENTATION=
MQSSGGRTSGKRVPSVSAAGQQGRSVAISNFSTL